MDIKGFKSRDGVVHKYDYNALVNVPEGGSTPSGGKDGGYYTPAVTQPNRETIQFAFTPSKADMPNVNPVTVSLPNPGGNGADAILPLVGSTDEITPTQVYLALVEGRQVMLQLTAEDKIFLFTSFNLAGSSDAYSSMILSTIVGLTGDVNRPQCDVIMLVGSTEGKTWSVMHQQLPVMADVPTDEYIKGLIEAELKNHPGSGGNVDQLKGHTWSVMGDSISHDDMYTNMQYWDYLSERCGGLTVCNYGVSGHRITDMATRYGTMNNSDIITVFGGVNDWGQANPTPIGEFGDSDTSTFYGALNVLLKGLLTQFPKSLIAFILPLGNKGFSGFAEDKNELGYTLEQYIEAIINACERYKVPFVDTRRSKLTPYVETTKLLYFVDGLHLNAYGHEVLSYEIESELKSHYIPTVSDSDETTPVISSISATYNGGDVTVGTAITELTGIVVTAHYSDGSTETVTGYTLSGEIAEGENSITVSYGGKTTTFTVTGVSGTGESIVEVAMSDVGGLINKSYLNTGATASYGGWNTYDNKLEVSGYSIITGRFCCHYLPETANVPYIVFFGKEDEVVGWEGLNTDVGESEREDVSGGYGYSIEQSFVIPNGAVTAALNGTKDFFDAYYNSGTYLLTQTKLTGVTAYFDSENAVIYKNSSLSTLKKHLTVFAVFEDSSTVPVDGYNLSGSLTDDVCTITVEYSGMTTTFVVNTIDTLNTINVNATIKKAEINGVSHVGFLVEVPVGMSLTVRAEVDVDDISKIYTGPLGGPWEYASVDNFNTGNYARVASTCKIEKNEDHVTISKTQTAASPYWAIFVPILANSNNLPVSVQLSNVSVYIDDVAQPILAVGTYMDNSTGTYADIIVN